MKTRILCLDIGDKKIGVAVSDPLGLTAQGVMTLPRSNFKEDCYKIVEFLKKYQIKKVLLGLPLNLENEEGPQAKKVMFFKDGLEKFLEQSQYEVEIELLDESFSSKEAEAILVKADVSRKKRRKVIDKMAATLLLQNYLNQQ